MKLKDKFEQLKRQNEIANIIYLTAGYPTVEDFEKILTQISDYGADIIEIGVPFSDPTADGKTIQYSSYIALQNKTNLEYIFNLLKKIKLNIPVVLMSYLNPLINYNKGDFSSDYLFKKIKEVNIAGIIIPDLPIGLQNNVLYTQLSDKIKKYDIDNILLATLTTSEERLRTIATETKGFLYCVSVTGTTGVRNDISEKTINFLKKVRTYTNKPIALGFGISKPEHVEKIKNFSDGVIIGSRIIDAISNEEDLEKIIKKFKNATRR